MEHGEKETLQTGAKSADDFAEPRYQILLEYEKMVERKVAEYNLSTRTVSRPGKQE